MIKIMNTVGNPKRTLVRGIIAILIGVAIFTVPGLTLSILIQVLGALLIADGILNFMLYKLKKEQQTTFMIIPRGISGIIFGLILLIFPTFTIQIFIFLIGFILIFAGASQLIAQLGGRSLLGFSLFYTIIAVIGLLSGIVLFLKPFESAGAMMRFVAIIIAIYGMGEIYWAYRLHKGKSKQIITPQNGPSTIDTDYEEIK